MKPIPRLSTVLPALWLCAAACGDAPTQPVEPDLVGVWRLIAFADGDEVAAPSGTWVFFDDGFMALDLQFTFDDESPRYLAATGNFTVTSNSVMLEIRGSKTEWSMEFRGDLVNLRQTAPDPADNRMTLERI